MNEDISSTNYDEIEIPESSEKEQEYLRKKQEEVDFYNRNIHEVSPIFAKRRIVQDNVIVRLFKLDFVKKVEVMGQESLVRAFPKLKIPDGHNEHGREKYKQVENLLAYKFEGIIVDFDEALLEKHPYLKRGLTVQLNPFPILEYVYYPDRSKEDEPWTNEDVKKGKNVIPNFEGYAKVRMNMIESYEL